MAALIPKNGLQLTNRQTLRAACAATQICQYSQSPKVIKNPSTSQLKRGTGGRSSFNGIVCTVFGNTGFIGSYICNRLGKIGTQIILPHRCDHYNLMKLKLCGDLGQVLFHPYDLRDEDSIRKCVKYSNVVINCIGRDWETKNFKYNDVHVDGARRLARICKEMGVERFIHVSALNANPKPKPILLKGGSRFYKSKWEGEWAVKEEFPEATIIRPAVIYGQEDKFLILYTHFLRRMDRCVPLHALGEETEKQPIHVSDVVAGIVACVKDPATAGRTYQFVGPTRYKLSELVTWIQNSIIYNAKEAGYTTSDLKWNIYFKWRISLIERISPGPPLGNLHWEGLEKEHTTDVVLRGVPTLEDLGVQPILMEDQVPWELKPFRIDGHYRPEFGEFDPPPLPKSVPLKLVEQNY